MTVYKRDTTNVSKKVTDLEESQKSFDSKTNFVFSVLNSWVYDKERSWIGAFLITLLLFNFNEENNLY